MDRHLKAVPSDESVRAAMTAAWQDHHHARDQTWRSLQIEVALGAGLITVDAQFQSAAATSVAGALVVVAALCGLGITWNHRRLERRKFIHLMNCEEFLGLHRCDLIPLSAEALAEFGVTERLYAARTDAARCGDVVRDSEVQVPRLISFWDAFKPWIHNTAVFILRMHLAIILFTIILVGARLLAGPRTP